VAQLFSLGRMKRFAPIFVFLLAWCATAQQLQTNVPSLQQAIKVASQLGVHMRERNVTAFVERNGLHCELIRLGGSMDWANVCPLTNKCSLEMHFRENGLFRKRQYGLLDGVFIQSNGVRIVTINLTNTVEISNAP